jgi:hypothetical protein
MTVPVHNLYDFVHQATKNKFLLLYFYPWGHKSLTDVHHYQLDQAWLDGPRGISVESRVVPFNTQIYNSWVQIQAFQPVILCHDQEPLHFDLYNSNSDFVKHTAAVHKNQFDIELSPQTLSQNLRLSLLKSVQKTWILLHSELNSPEVSRYESTGKFQGAYWWSHAVIARDWYRYAQHDQALQPGHLRKLFLCYSRDTAGSRLYRKDFQEQLHEVQLDNQCQFQSFDSSPVGADASAIYNPEDFNHTAISVVLETVFDQRIHLTEKILRAIACGHPFILAAGPGSLQLLRSYGFHTFQGYINEDYDTIVDPALRLQAIVKEMNRIANLPQTKQTELIKILRSIADHNRQRFFSDDFFQLVVDQLKRNVNTAFAHHQGKLDFSVWWQQRRWRKQQLGTAWKQVTDRRNAIDLVLAYRQQRLSQLRTIIPSQDSSRSDSCKVLTLSKIES